jgi:HTH-type transcriptional regulator/antitoxin HipB
MVEETVQDGTLDGKPTFLQNGRKFQDIKDKLVGDPGTPERERYDIELNRKLISLKIREFRKQHNLTQSELGERVGVQKNQISKLERSPVNVTLDTLIKVFNAMHVKLNLSFEQEAPPISKVKKALLFVCLFAFTYSGISPAPQVGAFF